MKILLYFLLFILSHAEDPPEPPDPPEPGEEEDHIDQAYNNATELFRQIMLYGAKTALESSSINQNCYDIFSQAFSDKDSVTASKYLYKLITDSSKSKNDMGAYTQCFNSIYSVGNTNTSDANVTFILIHVNETIKNSTVIDLNYTMGQTMFGACVPNGCNSSEYGEIFYYINDKMKIFGNLKKGVDYETFDLKKDYSTEISGLCNLPVFIIIGFSIFSLITIIPQYLFYIFLYNRTDDINDKIKSCFKFIDNSEELFSHGSSITSNDTGLKAFKGLRGLTLIFYLMSNVFLQIFINPYRLYQPSSFLQFLKSFMFTFIIYGIRFGPKIFYALSGFILVFKFLHYLDNQTDKEQLTEQYVEAEPNSVDEIVEQKEEEPKDPFDNNTSILDRDSFIENGEQQTANLDELLKQEENTSKPSQKMQMLVLSTDHYDAFHSKIPFSELLKFIFRTTYKYIMIIVATCHFKYSIIDMTLRTLSPTMPILCYFHEYFSTRYHGFNHLIAHLFFFYGYTDSTYFRYDPFIIPYNEMFFFIVGSILIFYCYKKNWRLDLIIIFLFIIFESGKIVVYLLINNPKVDQKVFYPNMVYQENQYSYIIHNPLFNFPSFLIGIFFGMVNYCIQSGVAQTSNKKRFLKIPKKVFSIFTMKSCSKFVIAVISMLMFMINAGGFAITIMAYSNYSKSDEKSIRYFYDKRWTGIMAMYDTDIGVFFLLFFIIQLFLVGDNIVFSFLEAPFWNYLSRPYFLNMITICSNCFYIFYLAENKLQIDFLNICFFSVVILLFNSVECVFMFIFIEIPLKKLNKLIIYAGESNKRVTKKEM